MSASSFPKFKKPFGAKIYVFVNMNGDEQANIEDLGHGWENITETEEIRQSLLKWYDRVRRKLPWRGDALVMTQSSQSKMTTFFKPKAEKKENEPETERIVVTPYGTWVSEIMLQQTRVDTVVDYYQKWMKLFPTLADLAAAEPEQVNAAWAGLGFYRRVRALHEGSKFVMEKWEGVVPDNVAELLTIPGIGPYTAGT